MIRSGAFVVVAFSGAGIAAPAVDLQVPGPVTAVTSEMLDGLPSGRRIEDLVRTCPLPTVPTVDRKSLVLIDGVTAQPSIECIRPDDIQMVEVLTIHNDLRAQYGSRPLAWDPVLAAQARSYGPTLAQFIRPVHSPRTGREWSRENLVQALRGTPTNRMLGVWVGERSNFTPGIFPNVSTTGDWSAVGHFTQMIWPTTTSVGCAVQRGIGRFDWLICRYAPPGNKDGVRIGPALQSQVADRSVLDEIDEPPATAPVQPTPPPPPTAGDEAPGGVETSHPLYLFANEAFKRHAAAVRTCDRSAAERALSDLRYAIDEMFKRLRAARTARRWSAVRPEAVERNIDDAQRWLGHAEDNARRAGCPRPPPPPPPPPP